ncbi:MAG: retroviral-like aspartic protease family protein [Clostridiales bacterium]|nr:retroviral-like aspartic protease family protein [Clostridiales bacterium]
MKVLYCTEPQMLETVEKKFANLPLINVEINGNKIPMVFDTGASMTIINESTQKIARISKEGKEVIGAGNLGVKFKSNTKIIEELRIGKILISDLEIIVVEDSTLDFGIDEDGNELKIDGFLGWDVIQNFSWKVNRIDNEIEVSNSVQTVNDKNLFWDNMPIIPVSIDKEDLYFGFDTGNTESILGSKFNVSLRKTHHEKELIAGIDGRDEIEIEKLDLLNLNVCGSEIQLKNLTIFDRDVFPTTKYEVQGLLAADLIENKILWLDFKNNKILIE